MQNYSFLLKKILIIKNCHRVKRVLMTVTLTMTWRRFAAGIVVVHAHQMPPRWCSGWVVAVYCGQFWSKQGKMAAPSTTAGLPPASSPGFAVLCSFLERYGSVLDLPELNFSHLERYLQETSAGKTEPCFYSHSLHIPSHHTSENTKFVLMAMNSVAMVFLRFRMSFNSQMLFSWPVWLHNTILVCTPQRGHV